MTYLVSFQDKFVVHTRYPILSIIANTKALLRERCFEQLAKKLGLVKSTLTIHLRRAEHRPLAEMINE
jgi:DNA-binding MarR family transcriptional regulator